MENNTLVKISGLKCDNPNCDYNDPSIKVEDYEKWIDAPCPKCGQSLLTQADYDTVQKILKITKFFSLFKLPNWMKKRSVECKVECELDGSGKMKIKSTS